MPKFTMVPNGECPQYYDVVYGPILLVEQESYQVASNIVHAANNATLDRIDHTECGEVANVIVAAIARW